MPANEKNIVRVHLEVGQEGTPLSISGAAAAAAPNQPVAETTEVTEVTEIDVEA